ncbi:MAG: hypothetical protein HY096_14420 [Nitrospinae bacterium]|nr:hypothetical protein [Nitrospinota bacterium]
MNLPNLPTDNLYKFIALSGLLISILTIILPIKINYDIRLKDLTIKKELAILNIELNFLKQNQTNKQQTLEELKDLRIKLIQQESKNKELEKYDDTTIYFFIYGLMTSTIGFSLWYSKVQKYNDIIIKNTAENK